MSEETEQQTINWVQSLKKEDLDLVLDELELDKQGSYFKKCYKLHDWLLGNYTAEDFVQSIYTNEVEAKTHREGLRNSFMEITLHEKTGSTLFDAEVDSEHPHPLSFIQKDEIVIKRLENLREPMETPNPEPRTQHSEADKEKDDNAVVTNEMQENEEIAADIGNDKQDTSIQTEIVNCVKAIERKVDTVQDKSFQLYYQLYDIIKQQQADLKKQHAEIRELMRMGKPSNPASSTRIENVDPTTLNDTRELSGAPQGNPGSRVNFQDTYDFRTYNSSSPVGAGERHSQQLRNEEFARQLNNMQIGDNRQNITSQTPLNQTHPSRYDVGNIVRRWNINYNGEDGQSIEHFFTRVEECRWLAGLSEKEILCSLSELLKGSAAIWYRNNRTKWHTWQEFTGAARAWYGTKNLQQRLKEDTMARTQGDEEPVRVYVAKMQALLQKMVPTPIIEEQVSIIRENMLPQLQALIRRENIDDIETLLTKAVEAEMLLKKEKNFRPPPPADTMLLPELGYQPPRKQVNEKTKVSAIATQEQNSVADTNTTEIMGVLGTLLKKMNELSTQQRNSNNTAEKSFGKKSGFKQNRQQNNQTQEKNRTSDNTHQGTSKGQERSKPKQFRCYNCNEIGHLKNKCPKLQENFNGKGS